MARTQAADYGDRRAAIRDGAARLYAKHGFLGASVAQVAAACGVSKSLLYHYYASKEDILFDVMDGHLEELIAGAKGVDARDLPPADKLRALSAELMRRYGGAEAYQKVLLNELGNLPADGRAAIVGRQRELMAIVDRVVAALRPDMAKPERTVALMLFFGMLNWTGNWFDPAGPVAAERVADMAAAMFLGGVTADSA